MLRLKRLAGPVHTLLVRKYFIDELYDFVWVKGCLLVAKIARFVDTWVVDLMFDTLAAITERIAAFSGMVLDNHGVDGVINGTAKTAWNIGGLLRAPQTGRIRNYVLFAAGVATIVLVVVLVYASKAASPVAATIAMGG